ncbi:Saccharopine dehydrogenase [Pyrobaculum islandicum DSM 4184]|uniref:Saccharopine dehydrogenase n=1 Tax=Pyrobaculum islandicum (strain DSM 4184 / JCM 9189 / GEO3) TaxID=384616 RepID=A1RUZ3_PYRIL|nr:saccharopine dehydrogenase C-terminal domain-containing protein [Pyrobaculum islandicum]ABL88775.1 Saccharopine dehydrogenase [Pyrobaculum islandicum DSM 4184]
MRVLVLGCGNIGRYVYDYLSTKHDVVVVDKAKACPNALQQDALETPLGGYDLVINALPGSIAYKASKRALEAGLDTIDISYYAEDPLSLHQIAVKSGARYIPDAGIAPGLSNILAGRLAAELDRVDELGIYVGGIPEKPVGPLGYSVTWNPLDLVEEYTRPARVLKNGEVTSVDPLNEVEYIHSPIGELEAFYTDGLRTLLKTLADRVSTMYEKTLRWPGHVEKIRLLRDLGLMDESGEPPPRLVTATVLSKLKFDVPDVVYMRVFGTRGDKKIQYEVLVKSRDRWTAMQIATGSVAIAMQYVIKELEPGVTPPEYIGMSNKLFPRIISTVKQHGVYISREVVERVVL